MDIYVLSPEGVATITCDTEQDLTRVVSLVKMRGLVPVNKNGQIISVETSQSGG